MEQRLIIAACETLGPEIAAAVAASKAPGVEHLPLRCRCGVGSLRWEHLPNPSDLPEGAHLHVYGGGCLSHLLADAAAHPNVHLHPLGACQELIVSPAIVDALVQRGAYMVTGGWLRSWEHRLAELGAVDRESRRMFSETCHCAVLLDSGVGEPQHERLAQFAEAVSLPWEVLAVGNEVMERRLEVLVLQRDLAAARELAAPALQQAADHAMALDVFAELAGAKAEASVVDGIFRLLNVTMAPRALVYVPVVHGQPGVPTVCGEHAEDVSWVPLAGEPYVVSQDGFSFAIQASGSHVAVVHVQGLAHPQHCHRYLALALNVVAVCGMAIEKAREHEKLLAAEAALSGEKDRLATTLRSIGDGVLATDVSGNVVLMNEVAEKLTGWSQAGAAGRPWQDVLRIVHEKSGTPEHSLVHRVVSSGEPVQLANGVRLQHLDGTWRTIADCAAPIRDLHANLSGVVIVFRDVTHAERVERELQRVERLDSLAVFASGLAHDFNNLLATILANVSLVHQRMDATTEQAACLADVLDAGQRASGLTRQLLTFSRGGAPAKVTMSVADVVRECGSLPLRGTNTRLEVTADPLVWLVDADPSQLGQVVHNLVINASQAMPRGGVVRVECRNASPGEVAARPSLPARCVHISVSDEGQGIPAEILPRIFDPFFTTKATGNGLGLAVVHSIVHRHNGHIEVDPTPLRGATFRIFLPASEGHLASGTAPPPRLVQGHGRILVMDDEAGVRRVTERILARLGYSVVGTADGDEAVRVFRAAHDQAQPFDLVLLDMTVPGGMGGLETLAALKAIDPRVKAVAFTGYANAPVMSDSAGLGFSGAMAKPFDMPTLSRTIGAVLES